MAAVAPVSALTAVPDPALTIRGADPGPITLLLLAVALLLVGLLCLGRQRQAQPEPEETDTVEAPAASTLPPRTGNTGPGLSHTPPHAEADPAESTAALAERLQGAIRLRDELMGFLSHELRTPLAAVRSFAELLRITPDMKRSEREEFLTIIEQECQRLARLSHDMQEFALIESGHVAWSDRLVDVVPTCKQVVKTLTVLAAHHNVHLVLQHAPDLPLLRVDVDRISQLLTNLISNALKFTPGGGQVTVRIHQGEDQVHFLVRDTGPGIPGDLLPHVFERYVKTPSQHGLRFEGTGLGLAICQRIVSHYQGTIQASNHPQGGTQLHVILPCPAPVMPAV